MTLSPEVPGVPRVADHEITVWVTIWGVQEPLIVHIVRGFRGSETSARIGLAEPFITRRASCVAGAPVQAARMAAQAGTVASLGCGLADGLGDGVGDGVGVGLGEALDDGLVAAEGLEWATTGPFGVQAAAATSAPMSTNPLLTRA
jgi:hypothetical protein